MEAIERRKKILSPKTSVLILARPRAQPAKLRVSSYEKVIYTLIRLRNSGFSEGTLQFMFIKVLSFLIWKAICSILRISLLAIKLSCRVSIDNTVRRQSLRQALFSIDVSLGQKFSGCVPSMWP